MGPDDLLKVLLAIAAGGVIGLEREFRDKAAGFRTMIFICLGSALFTIFSIELSKGTDGAGDPTRIASNIVSGVGFLGAGVILRNGGRVIGLTTAAAVWLVAAIGMGIGAASYSLSLAVTGMTVVILLAFPILERWVDGIRDERIYEVVLPLGGAKAGVVEQLFRDSGLRVTKRTQTKDGAKLTCTWKTAGAPEKHDRLVRELLADPEVEKLRY